MSDAVETEQLLTHVGSYEESSADSELQASFPITRVYPLAAQYPHSMTGYAMGHSACCVCPCSKNTAHFLQASDPGIRNPVPLSVYFSPVYPHPHNLYPLSWSCKDNTLQTSRFFPKTNQKSQLFHFFSKFLYKAPLCLLLKILIMYILGSFFSCSCLPFCTVCS